MNSYPPSLIFIAADKESFDFIKNRKGKCLFYEEPPHVQMLSFCHQREVWVLYATPQHYPFALKLGRQIQLTGSQKILLIRIQR
jgi:hypothetical protein